VICSQNPSRSIHIYHVLGEIDRAKRKYGETEVIGALIGMQAGRSPGQTCRAHGGAGSGVGATFAFDDARPGYQKQRVADSEAQRTKCYVVRREHRSYRR
jgi:hypothetical protein